MKKGAKILTDPLGWHTSANTGTFYVKLDNNGSFLLTSADWDEDDNLVNASQTVLWPRTIQLSCLEFDQVRAALDLAEAVFNKCGSRMKIQPSKQNTGKDGEE